MGDYAIRAQFTAACEPAAVVRWLDTVDGIAGWWSDTVGGRASDAGDRFTVSFPDAPMDFELEVREASEAAVEWFVAENPGSYDLFCAEYCGVGHADMITTVEALPEAEFREWLSVLPPKEDAGKELLQKHGCLGCHSLDGTKMVGPTFQGIGGREVVVIKDGAEDKLVSDQAYLERAILEPGVEIVKGYPPAMPTYAGRIPEDEVSSIFDKFIQSSRTKTGAGGTGLGLSISREIVMAHHGRIWACNSPDGGAAFTFVLPIRYEAPARSAEAA